MYYVYILQSFINESTFYVGITTDLKKRMLYHNTGLSPHTNKYKPWSLHMYIAFQNKTKAFDFEKYLKSASGRAFTKKHL